jgi:3-oxoacyl-(acyl-carrier-protein) synthase
MRMNYYGDRPVPRRGQHSISDVSRPHAEDAAGTVGGEGAASLVLETAPYAASRSAKPLARILAASTRFIPSEAMKDGDRSSAMQPAASRDASAAIAAAARSVLEQAGVTAADIGLVISHATGDRQADRGEAKAIDACGLECPVLAVSASVGHCGAASGMMEVAAGVLAITHRTIPPTRNASAANGVRLLTTAQPLSSPIVLCLSHTTSGNAIAVLLGE